MCLVMKKWHTLEWHRNGSNKQYPSKALLTLANPLLTGLPASATKPLQCIQNTAARLIFNLPKFPCDTLFRDLHWLSLDTSQDDGAGLQGRQRNCARLPPNTGQTTRPSANTSLHYISWAGGTAIGEREQRSLSKFTTLFWDLSGAKNSRPMSGQQSRSPSSAKDSRLTQSSPQPCIAWLYYAQTRVWKLFLFFHLCLIDGDMLWFLLVSNVLTVS